MEMKIFNMLIETEEHIWFS